MTTPLHLAIESIEDRNILSNVVQLLLEVGADVEAKNRAGETTIFPACKRGLGIVKRLAEHGADIDARCKYEATPLMSACENNDLEIVKYLVKSGADINAEDKSGESVLFFGLNSKEIVDYLVENGANAKSLKGRHEALYKLYPDNMDIIETLVTNGLDIDTEISRDGNTFLTNAIDHIGYGEFHGENCERLLKLGADINIGNGLSSACIDGDVKKIKWLVEHGADVNIRCHEGYTILRYALDSECQDERMVDYLIEHGARLTADGKDWYEATERRRR